MPTILPMFSAACLSQYSVYPPSPHIRPLIKIQSSQVHKISYDSLILHRNVSLAECSLSRNSLPVGSVRCCFMEDTHCYSRSHKAAASLIPQKLQTSVSFPLWCSTDLLYYIVILHNTQLPYKRTNAVQSFSCTMNEQT